jgi:hypothetical protein
MLHACCSAGIEAEVVQVTGWGAFCRGEGEEVLAHPDFVAFQIDNLPCNIGHDRRQRRGDCRSHFQLAFQTLSRLSIHQVSYGAGANWHRIISVSTDSFTLVDEFDDEPLEITGGALPSVSPSDGHMRRGRRPRA